MVREIPLERILIETDAPYLSPVPYRGKRNDSSYLVHVVEKIAQIKGITSEIVAEETFNNAVKLYRIDKMWKIFSSCYKIITLISEDNKLETQLYQGF